VARAGALARQHGPIWRGCGQRTNGLRGSSQSEGEIDGGSQWGNRQDLPPLPAILLRSLASDFRPRRHNVPSLLPACPATEPSFAGNAQSMVLLQWQSSWRCFAACVFTVCGVWTAGDDFGELAAPPVQEQQGPLNVRGRPLASWVTTHQPVRAAMSLRLAPKPTAETFSCTAPILSGRPESSDPVASATRIGIRNPTTKGASIRFSARAISARTLLRCLLAKTCYLLEPGAGSCRLATRSRDAPV
jgi:hypothetical protein